jgi:hypothetical protein
MSTKKKVTKKQLEANSYLTMWWNSFSLSSKWLAVNTLIMQIHFSLIVHNVLHLEAWYERLEKSRFTFTEIDFNFFFLKKVEFLWCRCNSFKPCTISVTWYLIIITVSCFIFTCVKNKQCICTVLETYTSFGVFSWFVLLYDVSYVRSMANFFFINEKTIHSFSYALYRYFHR